MSTLLVVSFDPQSVAALTELAASVGYRVRSVSEIEKAQEWLGMQSFDVLLVDSRYGSGIPLDLVEFGWRHNPFLVGGIYSLDGPIEDEWSARLMGIRVYSGTHAREQIKQMLESRPTWHSTEETHTFLLVEDLDSPREIICSYIESMGQGAVTGVSSMKEALALLRQEPNKYCAVLTDINMPEHSGIELIQEMRRDELLSHIPVIVLTAYATAENLIDTIKAGATGFLVKPPKKRLLRAELEKARRIFLTRQSPRLCRAEDAHLLEEALNITMR